MIKQYWKNCDKNGLQDIINYQTAINALFVLCMWVVVTKV